jgi:dTDP-4-dehydrorhamnose reductase
MSTLILGKGWIGNGLHKFLRQNDCVATIYNRRDIDYFNDTLLQSVLNTLKPTYLINCVGYSGYPNIDACETNKELCWTLNVDFPLRLARVCQANNIKFVNISSGCIFEGHCSLNEEPNNGLFSEESSFYCKTKHACEINLNQFQVYQFRIRMPFDEHPHYKNIISKVIEYSTLLVKDNSYTYLDDFYHLIRSLVNYHSQIPCGIYNAINPGISNLQIIYNTLLDNCPSLSSNKIKEKKVVNKVSDLNTKAGRSNCVIDVSPEIADYFLPIEEALLTSIKTYEWNHHAKFFNVKKQKMDL